MAGRREPTRRLAYAAVCTAIAILAEVISAFTPARIVPLALASLAIFVAFARSGWMYGIITCVASVLVAFFMAGPLSATFLFLCVLFVPYAIVAFLMRKLSYRVFWKAAVRLLVSAAVFAAAATAMVFLADTVAGTSFVALIGKIGPAWACVLTVVAALPADLFFSFAAERIVRLLK